MTECTHCGASTGDGRTLCARHESLLEKVLTNVRAYYGDLETLRTKTTRYGDAGKGSIGKTMPLGVDLRFAAVRTHEHGPTCPSPCTKEGVIVEGQATAAEHAVRSLVVTWARVVLAAHVPAPGPVCARCLHRSCATIRRARHPQDNVPSVLSYLHGWVRWIAAQDWAGAMLVQVIDAERTLACLVDRPAGQWYAGPCDEPCGRDLYAVEGAAVVKCRACSVEYDVAPRRDWLLAAAEDQLADAATIARAVSWLGAESLTSDRVRQWGRRKRLLPHLTERCTTHALEHDEAVTISCLRCQPLYRIGDAIDLLAASARKGA